MEYIYQVYGTPSIIKTRTPEVMDFNINSGISIHPIQTPKITDEESIITECSNGVTALMPINNVGIINTITTGVSSIYSQNTGGMSLGGLTVNIDGGCADETYGDIKLWDGEGVDGNHFTIS